MTRRQNNYNPPKHTFFEAPDLSYLTINPGETLESLERKMRIASNIRQNIQNFAADLDRKLKAITEAAFESVKRITIRQDEDTPGWKNHTITPAEKREKCT